MRKSKQTAKSAAHIWRSQQQDNKPQKYQKEKEKKENQEKTEKYFHKWTAR